MKRQLLAACTLALLVAASPSLAANGNIGIFADTGLATCQASVPCDGSITLYVYALLQGASQAGISGAEYKVQIGLDTDVDDLLFAEVFDVTATTIGTGAFNPPDVTERGINLAYAECNVGDGTKVLLETVTVFDMGGCGTETRLTVVKHDNQSNDFFLCPLFTLCDAPAFSKVCLGSNIVLCQNPNPPFANDSRCSTSGEFVLNPLPGSDCTVAVEETTWSKVKGLYAN